MLSFETLSLPWDDVVFLGVMASGLSSVLSEKRKGHLETGTDSGNQGRERKTGGRHQKQKVVLSHVNSGTLLHGMSHWRDL